MNASCAQATQKKKRPRSVYHVGSTARAVNGGFNVKGGKRGSHPLPPMTCSCVKNVESRARLAGRGAQGGARVRAPASSSWLLLPGTELRGVAAEGSH